MTVRAVHRSPDDEDRTDLPPGTYWFVHGVRRGGNPLGLPVNDDLLPADAFTLAGIAFVCPGGCGTFRFVHLENPKHDAHGLPVWTWNMDRELPSLQPSLRATKPPGCGWHGHLTAGVFVACEDSACPDKRE